MDMGVRVIFQNKLENDSDPNDGSAAKNWSGTMNRRTAIRRLATFFLTTASLAHAQQAKKVFRC